MSPENKKTSTKRSIYRPISLNLEKMMSQDTDERSIGGIIISAANILHNHVVSAETRASRAEWIAGHDYMTNLLTRRGFDDSLEGWLEKSMNTKPDGDKQDLIASSRVVATCIDLDDLKGINDNYGHEMGDIAIKVLSTLVVRNNKEGLNVRLGGDEIASVSLAGGDVDNLLFSNELRDNILGVIRDKETDDLNKDFLESLVIKYGVTLDERPSLEAILKNMSFSIGSSNINLIYMEKSKIWDHIKSADNAMYEDKNSDDRRERMLSLRSIR